MRHTKPCRSCGLLFTVDDSRKDVQDYVAAYRRDSEPDVTDQYIIDGIDHCRTCSDMDDASDILPSQKVETWGIGFAPYVPSFGKFDGEGPATEWFYQAGNEWSPEYYGSDENGGTAMPFIVDGEARAMFPPSVANDVGDAYGVVLYESDSGFCTLDTFATKAEFEAECGRLSNLDR